MTPARIKMISVLPARGGLLAARGGLLALAMLTAAACATTGATPADRVGVSATALPAAAVPAAPDTASGTIAQAWLQLRVGTVEVASAAAAQMAPADAATAVGQALTGFLNLRRGNVGAAQDAFGAAVALDPGLAEAAYGMGLVAQSRGRDDLARQWFDTAAEVKPALTRASLAVRRIDLQGIDQLLAAAERAIDAGDTVTAIASYREAIRLGPTVEGAYLRLAMLHQDQDDPASAIAVLEQGLRSIGDSPALLEQVGSLYRQAGRLAEASDAFDRLRLAMPGDERVAALARQARSAYESAALPSEYRALASKREITREELAAVLAINLSSLEARLSTGRGVIIADAGNSWSASYIRQMVEWGVMDVYQNDFMPQMVVRRSMLVEACYRVLEMTGLAAGSPRPRLEDPPPEHLLYRQTQAVVGLDLMQTDREGSVDLLAPVSGAEALITVERLAALLRRSG